MDITIDNHDNLLRLKINLYIQAVLSSLKTEN